MRILKTSWVPYITQQNMTHTWDSFPSILLLTSKSIGIPTTPSLLVCATAEVPRGVKSDKYRMDEAEGVWLINSAFDDFTIEELGRPSWRLAAVTSTRLIIIVVGCFCLCPLFQQGRRWKPKDMELPMAVVLLSTTQRCDGRPTDLFEMVPIAHERFYER